MKNLLGFDYFKTDKKGNLKKDINKDVILFNTSSFFL